MIGLYSQRADVLKNPPSRKDSEAIVKIVMKITYLTLYFPTMMKNL